LPDAVELLFAEVELEALLGVGVRVSPVRDRGKGQPSR
jgi:hypothetical protein